MRWFLLILSTLLLAFYSFFSDTAPRLWAFFSGVRLMEVEGIGISVWTLSFERLSCRYGVIRFTCSGCSVEWDEWQQIGVRARDLHIEIIQEDRELHASPQEPVSLDFSSLSPLQYISYASFPALRVSSEKSLLAPLNVTISAERNSGVLSVDGNVTSARGLTGGFRGKLQDEELLFSVSFLPLKLSSEKPLSSFVEPFALPFDVLGGSIAAEVEGVWSKGSERAALTFKASLDDAVAQLGSLTLEDVNGTLVYYSTTHTVESSQQVVVGRSNLPLPITDLTALIKVSLPEGEAPLFIEWKRAHARLFGGAIKLTDGKWSAQATAKRVVVTGQSLSLFLLMRLRQRAWSEKS